MTKITLIIFAVSSLLTLMILVQLGYLKEDVEASALILSIINGLLLFYQVYRDRPQLKIHLVRPEFYQWWIRLSDRTINGKTTRRFGFFVYFSVVNHGLRGVEFHSWHLFIKVPARFMPLELYPLNIPYPEFSFNHGTKFLNVFGQKYGELSGETFVSPGCSVSGVAYYELEIWGDEKWNPNVIGDEIKANLVVTDGFKSQTKITIRFKEKSLEDAYKIVPSIGDLFPEKNNL